MEELLANNGLVLLMFENPENEVVQKSLYVLNPKL